MLPEVLASVSPRRRSPYNDLAVPIKVMEYLSYERPLIVTDCTEQARIVTESGAGVAVPDTVAGLAEGILRVATAHEAQLDAWSSAAGRAAEKHSWSNLTRRILLVLLGQEGPLTGKEDVG